METRLLGRNIGERVLVFHDQSPFSLLFIHDYYIIITTTIQIFIASRHCSSLRGLEFTTDWLPVTTLSFLLLLDLPVKPIFILPFTIRKLFLGFELVITNRIGNVNIDLLFPSINLENEDIKHLMDVDC